MLAELLLLELDLRFTLSDEQPTESDYSDTLPGDALVIGTVFARWREESDELLPNWDLPGRNRPLPLPTIEGYEIIDELGRGGMGVVYDALHLGLKRRVALKVLLLGQYATAEHLARMRAEAEIVARLKHPNIISIFDIGERDGFPYLTFERIEGLTLGEYTRQQPQPPRLAAELIATAARAVHYAHQKGIVHRDLKPSNILLDGATREQPDSVIAGSESIAEDATGKSSSNGSILSVRHTPVAGLTPKITDFGLARDLNADSEETRSGIVLGTVHYMSPEQAAGRAGDVGPASDIYSLGAMLYMLLTGQPPFRGTTAVETLQMVIGSQPLPPTRLRLGLPKDLEAICLKCLQKDPARRYETAEALAEDLGRYLNDQPVLARVSRRFEKSWRWCRRNLLLSLSIVSVPLVLMAGFMFIRFLADAGSEPNTFGARSAQRPTVVTAGGQRLRSHRSVVPGDGLLTDGASTIDESVPAKPGASLPQIIPPYEWPEGAPALAIAPFDAGEAKQHQQAWADYLKIPAETTNTLGMKFVLIPPGEFEMGVEPGEINIDRLRIHGEELPRFHYEVSRASPRHTVRITRPYYLESHEVTFSLFRQVLGRLSQETETAMLNSSAHISISLLDAVEFCNELSRSEGKSPAHRIDDGKLTRVLDASGYRLPTEAEWAHACRAGTTTLWFFGNDPHGNGGEYASVLKEYQTMWYGLRAKPNPFGLFDMYGGSSEWCFDRFVPFRAEKAVDPYADPGSGTVVCRGGTVFGGAGTSLGINNSYCRIEATSSAALWHGLGRVVLPIALPNDPLDVRD